MRIGKLAAAMLALSMSMSACGGGSSGSSDSGQVGTGGIPPVVEQPTGGNGGANGFNAAATVAPAEGEVLSGLVRLEVEGYAIRNAELLPAAGGRPYALFNVAEDQSRAWVEFDTRTVTNGSARFMIEAYDQPPGTAGASVARAMEPRTWTIDNPTISSPFPGDYPLSRDASRLQALADLSDDDFASRIDSEWPRIHAMLQDYISDNVVFDPPVPRGFEGPRSSCIRDAYASPAACREYMLQLQGMIN